jgi:hypothetical protein
MTVKLTGLIKMDLNETYYIDRRVKIGLMHVRNILKLGDALRHCFSIVL